MFAVLLGVDRTHLEAMSIPEMVDHADYWSEVKGAQGGI